MAANKMIENNIQYTVKNQPEWFYKTLQKAHTIDNGYVRVLPNVTKDTYIKKLVMDKNTISQVDGRNCEWTPTQRFTFDGKTITVKNFKITIPKWSSIALVQRKTSGQQLVSLRALRVL